MQVDRGRAALIALPTIALLLALSSALEGTTSAARPDDWRGTLDFSYTARGAAVPSADGPTASGLWFADGTWWGILFRPSRDAHVINRYDAGDEQWVDTGTVVDDRNASRSDVLWDGQHLYVVSGGSNPSDDAGVAILARLSYDSAAGRFDMDEGFPVTVAPPGAGSYKITRDATGTLWVTWTRDGEVWVRRSLGDDRSWSVPTPLPVPQAMGLSSADASSVVAYGGRVGVMWSSRETQAMYWASIPAGQSPDSAWAVSVVVQGDGMADSRIDLLPLEDDPAGQVLAALKTERHARGGDPRILVLVLTHDATWERYVAGTVAENAGSPLLAVDADHRVLYLLTSNPCCDGGTIYYKRTLLDAIDFDSGMGTSLISRGAGSALDGPITTRQALTVESGLFVVAADAKIGRYMSALVPLTGEVVPRPSAYPPTGSSGGGVVGPPWLDDGFEDGTLDAWPLVAKGPGSQVVVDAGQARTGKYGARLTVGPAPGSYAYARFPLPEPQSLLAVGLDIQVLQEGGADSNVPLVRLLASDGSRLLSVYRQNLGRGGIWISTPDHRTETLGWLELGTWTHLDVQITAEGGNVLVDVRKDGEFIGRSAVTLQSGIAFVQIGNEVKDQQLDVAIDNVSVVP